MASNYARAQKALDDLLALDGAGSWPPRSTFEEGWPELLRPFAALCDQATERFAVSAERFAMSPSTTNRACPFATLASDNKIGTSCPAMEQFAKEKIVAFRTWMTDECEKSLPDLDAIVDVLSELGVAETNGFLCCISFLLHMYRWGVIPVVKYAQTEKSHEFPPKLWEPFKSISEKKGLSLTGNAYSIYYCNVIQNHEGRFAGTRFSFVDRARFGDIRTCEINFMHLFFDMERAALPMYSSMVDFHRHLDEGEEVNATQDLRAVREGADATYKAFHGWLQESLVNKSTWLRYLQGPLGSIIPNVPGFSGAAVLSLPATDAFLSISGKSEVYHFALGLRDFMTTSMRSFIEEMASFGLADSLNSGKYTHSALYDEYEMCVSKLRGFRIGHKYKVLPYLREPAPERAPMTASGGVIQSSGCEEKIQEIYDEHLRDRLHQRIYETVSPVKKFSNKPLQSPVAKNMLPAAQITVILSILCFTLMHFTDPSPMDAQELNVTFQGAIHFADAVKELV